jgi:hypothetical protein
MRVILRSVLFVFMASALGACAGRQSEWQGSYAASPGYHDPGPNYDYRYERDSARAPCRCRYEQYDEDRRGDYTYHQ